MPTDRLEDRAIAGLQETCRSFDWIQKWSKTRRAFWIGAAMAMEEMGAQEGTANRMLVDLLRRELFASHPLVETVWHADMVKIESALNSRDDNFFELSGSVSAALENLSGRVVETIERLSEVAGLLGRFAQDRSPSSAVVRDEFREFYNELESRLREYERFFDRDFR